jgi:hypothetical protein
MLSVSQKIKAFRQLRYIADFVIGVPKTGVDDIINYFSLEKFLFCWRHIQN